MIRFKVDYYRMKDCITYLSPLVSKKQGRAEVNNLQFDLRQDPNKPTEARLDVNAVNGISAGEITLRAFNYSGPEKATLLIPLFKMPRGKAQAAGFEADPETGIVSIDFGETKTILNLYRKEGPVFHWQKVLPEPDKTPEFSIAFNKTELEKVLKAFYKNCIVQIDFYEQNSPAIISSMESYPVTMILPVRLSRGRKDLRNTLRIIEDIL